MRNLAAVRALDSGRHVPKVRLGQADYTKYPYWDASCQSDEAGNLNVAAAAGVAVAGWCLTGNAKLRRGLIERLGHLSTRHAARLVDEARATRGDLMAHDQAVSALRDELEKSLIDQVRSGALAVA